MPMPMSASLPGAQRMLDLQQTGNALALSMVSFLSTTSQLRGPSIVDLASQIRLTAMELQNAGDDSQREVLQVTLQTLQREMERASSLNDRVSSQNTDLLQQLRRCLFPSQDPNDADTENEGENGATAR